MPFHPVMSTLLILSCFELWPWWKCEIWRTTWVDWRWEGENTLPRTTRKTNNGAIIFNSSDVSTKSIPEVAECNVLTPNLSTSGFQSPLIQWLREVKNTLRECVTDYNSHGVSCWWRVASNKWFLNCSSALFQLMKLRSQVPTRRWQILR